jgi:DsbC/DsbD-like thiol-disulfide interchange protein/cytochrome c biogenesis protein CcdA
VKRLLGFLRKCLLRFYLRVCLRLCWLVFLMIFSNFFSHAASLFRRLPALTRVAVHTALLACAGLLALPSAAKPVRVDYVEAELVAAHASVQPGQTATLALRLKHDPHWHTYWRNPGDAGLPTTLTWEKVADASPGTIQWPVPERIPVVSGTSKLLSYAYEGEVFLPVTLTVSPTAAAGPIKLAARADWLMCKDICIPGSANLSLTLPVSADSPKPSAWAQKIAAAQSAVPTPAPSGFVVSAAKADGALVIGVTGGLPETVKRLHYFPFDEGKIEPAGEQTLENLGGGAWRLRMPLANTPVGELSAGGVLVAQHADGKSGVKPSDGKTAGGKPDGKLTAFEFTIALKPALDAAFQGNATETTIQRDVSSYVPGNAQSKGVSVVSLSPASTSGMSLWLAAGFALLGGLILNLMPCVFPVLSLKILGFAQGAGADVRVMRKHGLLFGAGVIVSFLALAGALLALKAGGAQVGWGFQLQSPAVVAALAVLFTLLALNLVGVFEFSLGQNAAAQVGGQGAWGAFLGGVLAVVAASPCTAPFMGAALGYAVSQGALEAMIVFLALGVGMALPYVLLSWFPAWLKKLPRPGVWMERLKHFLAFPLLATVVWLVWVLGVQTSVDGAARLLLALTVLALAAWCYGISQTGSRRWLAGAVLSVAGAAWLAWPVVADGADGEVAQAGSRARWHPARRCARKVRPRALVQALRPQVRWLQARPLLVQPCGTRSAKQRSRPP